MAPFSPFKRCNAAINLAFLFLLSFFLITNLNPFASPPPPPILKSFSSVQEQDCKELNLIENPKSKCQYLKLHTSCVPNGYINYLQLFYCRFGSCPILGYLLFTLWLIVLFYLLGNTASQYFCSSLESLSKVMKLTPAVAGVTLLSLGNGAPDVFSSIVSFTAGPSVSEVGLSSVLGGALFITTVVVGVISLYMGPRAWSIDGRIFIADICFLLFALISLFSILIFGKIGIWGSISFLCIYIGYVIKVWTSNCCGERKIEELEAPLVNERQAEENPVCIVMREVIESDHLESLSSYFKPNSANWKSRLDWFLHTMELPLSLPTRLTIPVVSEERWSKPFAVLSSILSPILLATIFNSSQSNEIGTETKLSVCLSGTLIGIILGILVMETTETDHPPKRFLFPWLASGFLMSVIWAYMVARELVSLLVSIGYIIGISPSILGVTVLAWGNSLGDLIADVAMAVHGGRDGAQVAVSGCYAGPLFNTVVGLGVSLVLASWNVYPSQYVITKDSSVYQTLIFMVLGLLWALLVVPRRGMKLDRVLGIGLLVIYLCFLCLRVSEILGLGKFGGNFSL